MSGVVAIAQYRSRCPRCSSSIDEGSRVRLVDDEGWVHAVCSGRFDLERPACGTCFTVPAVDGTCMCVGSEAMRTGCEPDHTNGIES